MTQLPLDMPDEYPWLPGSNRSPLADFGELAARLGSTVVYDRRGAVYLIDDFEDGVVGWYRHSAGSDAIIRPSQKFGMRGGFTCLMQTSSDDDFSANMQKQIPVYNLGAIGFEATFSMGIVPVTLSFTLQTESYGLTKQARVYFYGSESKIKILDSTNTPIDVLETNADLLDITAFHTMKLVADFEGNNYVRLIFDNIEYDIGATEYYEFEAYGYDTLYLNIRASSPTESVAQAYLDNIIITTGEL